MKLKDTLKLMSISLFQYQLVFFALEDLSLVDLLHRTSVEKVKVKYRLMDSRTHLVNLPSLDTSTLVLHSVIKPSLVVSLWSVLA